MVNLDKPDLDTYNQFHDKKEGFAPSRDIYFAFGHDEETGGAEGAVLGMHGTTLLSDSAGGYVLVAMASFALSSALTLACVRLREQGRQSETKDREKAEPPSADQ